MTTEKVKIEKIVVDIDGQKVELTMSQAKRLSEILGEMFDLKRYSPPYYPIIIERDPVNPWVNPPITYWHHQSPSWISENSGVPMSIENNAVCLEIGE